MPRNQVISNGGNKRVEQSPLTSTTGNSATKENGIVMLGEELRIVRSKHEIFENVIQLIKLFSIFSNISLSLNLFFIRRL